MDALVIGGTGFVGRHLVESLLDGGHAVTVLNRGQTNPNIYPDVEKLHGDRDSDLAVLNGRNWEVVFDVSGYLPRIVRLSAEKLHDHVQRYVYVSSLSAYADPLTNTDEVTAPLQTLEDPLVETIDGTTYGGLKVLCEQTISQLYGDRSLIVRPGYVVGRYDYIARLPYLVRRFKQGGERLAGRPNQPVQFIHARDIGDWLVRAAREALTGVFNLTGQPILMSALLDSLAQHTGKSTQITYTSDQFLLDHNIAPVDGLTFWLPEAYDPLMHTTIDRALATGLTLRSVDAVVDDVLSWDQPEHILTSPLGGSPDNIVLNSGREAELLAQWHHRTQS